MGKLEDVFQQTCAARDAFWKEWGDVDPYVLAPLVNPAFMRGPRWPHLRQALATVRRGSLTLLASDGLSDPFDDEDPPTQQGYGVEFFALTKDEIPARATGSWLCGMLWQICLNAADSGQFRSLIDKYGVIVTELYDVPVPDGWKNAEGRVGVLLGLTESGPSGVPSELALPAGDIRVVNVKLLTLAELNFAAERRAEGRAELARRFQSAPGAQRSSLSRPSVV